MTKPRAALSLMYLLLLARFAAAQAPAASPHPIVLHAARMLDVKAGRIVSPAEILVLGDRIAEVGSTVRHPSGAEVIDVGDRTLLPGMIDALARALFLLEHQLLTAEDAVMALHFCRKNDTTLDEALSAMGWKAPSGKQVQ